MLDHIKCCAGKAGYTYEFDSPIVNYQENFNKIGDLPFAIYYDFGTTMGSGIFYDAKVYVVSYCIVVAFHPDLKISHMVIYRSFDQSLAEVESLQHFIDLKKDFLSCGYHNLKTLKQLGDCALSVFNKSRNTALAEMFNVELKLVCDSLKTWFVTEIKSVEIDESLKDDFLKNNMPETCQICNFPINPFVQGGWFEQVCSAEYLYLQNIYKKKDLFRMGINDFETFFAKVKKVMDCMDEFCSSLESENLKNINSGEDNGYVEQIIEQIQNTRTCKGDTTIELTKKKTIYFLYRKSIDFLPNKNIDLRCPTSERFSTNLFSIYTNKRVVHHSHVSDKILGFVHEFCNLRVRENYYTIPVIAHNQFRFDFFFFLKGIRPTVWETTQIKIGAKNASNINFLLIGNQVRFIDTIKYFQQSLGNLAASMTDSEKENIKASFERVLAYRIYFFETMEDREWVLDYLASGKGTIPNQSIAELHALSKQPPEDGNFFDKESFYSNLKEKNISDEEYENVKKFFKLLKLETLGDLNKLYNIQDTLITCEIFEQRSQLLQELFKSNPRKCNSASAFSGYVHRNKSKCNIVLLLDTKIVRIFEKTLIGGYSCVNTRLSFDTEIFLKDAENEKVLFQTTEGELKRFSSKIIKMDENNQYGFAMTKPRPYGCIKKKERCADIRGVKRTFG